MMIVLSFSSLLLQIAPLKSTSKDFSEFEKLNFLKTLMTFEKYDEFERYFSSILISFDKNEVFPHLMVWGDPIFKIKEYLSTPRTFFVIYGQKNFS